MICLSYSAIVDNKRGMVYLICLSATNYSLNLLTKVCVKTHVPLENSSS